VNRLEVDGIKTAFASDYSPPSALITGFGAVSPYGVFSNPVCHRLARSAPWRSSWIASSRRATASRNDRFENTP
jgi:hypothetical protein